MKIAHFPLPAGFTIFCDDIRHEIEGKRTHVGVYSGVMFIHADPPVILPLAADITLLVDNLDNPILYKIEVYLRGDNHQETLFSTEVTIPPPGAPKPDLSDFPSDMTPHGAITFQAKWPQIVIRENSRLLVRAYYEDSEIRMGGLRIEFKSDSEAADQLFEETHRLKGRN